MTQPIRLPCLATMLLLVASLVPQASAQSISIATVDRADPVSFGKDILPILQRSCLACHNESDAYGDLVLESAESMLTGGDSGPAIVPGKSGESLLLQVASHQTDPVMPPEGNDVSARNLTSEELGLLKLWIDQGAQATGLESLLSPTDWKPLPPGNHPIFAVAVSPDGQFVACGRANQIFVYHVATGQLVTRLTDPSLQEASADKRPGTAHLDVVQSLAFNSRGDVLASGGFRTAKLWRYPPDVQQRTLEAGGELLAAAVSPDRTLAATGGIDGTIQLWTLETSGDEALSKPQLLEGHTAEIRGLCFTTDGERLVSVAADKTVRIWDTADGALAGRIDVAAELHSVAAMQLPAQNPEAEEAEPIERIVTGGADNLIRFWDVPNQLPQPLPKVPADTTVIAASREGDLLAMASAQGVVYLVDSQIGDLVSRWQAHDGPVAALAFGQSGPETADETADAGNVSPPAQRRLATAGDDGVVRVWMLGSVDAMEGDGAAAENEDAAHEGEPSAEPPTELFALRGSLTTIRSIDFRPDGTQLAAGAEDGALTIWNLEPPTEPALATRVLQSPVDSPIEAAASDARDPSRHLAALSPDGKRLATTSAANGHPAILVRDLATGKLLHTLLGHEAAITSLAFSRDNQKIVSGSVDQTARVWDLDSPKFAEVARFSGHGDAVTAVAFDSDAGQVLSGAADHSVKLWSVADAELVMDFAGHTGPIADVALTADDRPVSASADKTVRLWNPANGQTVRSQTESAAVTALSLSRDGSRMAVAAADNSVKVYAATGGAAQLSLTGHSAPVHSLAFSADDARLLSGDKTEAMVWDSEEGRLLEIVPLAEAELTCVAYGPTESQVLLVDNQQRVTMQSMRYLGAGREMTQPVSAVVWHPNGQSVIAGCGDGTVRGFNATNYTQTFSSNHGGAVHDLAISEDGAKLASSGENKLVKLWNPANGAGLQPAQLPPLAGAARCIDFSTDGERLIAGSVDGEQGQVLVFHLSPQAGLIEQSIAGHASSVADCLVIPGGQALSLSDDGVVLRWELLAAQRLAGHTQAVTSLASVPRQDGQPPQILSGSLDGTVRRWNVQTGQVLAQMNHGGPVTSVAVRADGGRWASASSNNTIRLWNAANNAQVAQMTGDLRAKALVAKLTQKKSDATAKLTDAKATLDAAENDLPMKVAGEKTAATALAATEKQMETQAAALAEALTKKATAEGKAIEAAAMAQAATKEMEEANLLAARMATRATELAAKAARAKAAATMAPENTTLAKLAEEATAEAEATEAAAKKAEAAKAAPAAAATKASQAAESAAQAALTLANPFTDADTALQESQQEHRAAKQAHEVATRDLRLAEEAVPAAQKAVSDIETLLEKHDQELAAAVVAEQESQQPIHSVAFSPDHRTLATGGDFGVVHTWEAETGAPVASFVGHGGPVSTVAYLDENAVLSSSADEKAIVWDLNPRWRLERVIGDIRDPSQLIDRVSSVDFSSDGRVLATASGVPSRSGEVKIWNVADGTLVQAIPEAHNDAATAVAFSPDDLRVASVGADRYLKTFSVATGEQLAQFEGHTNYALDVSWRGGGKLLASCGADGTIRIWDAESGDRVRVIQGFNKQVSAVRFVGGTQFAVVATGESFVRKYNTDNGGVQTNYGGSEDFMFAIDATADPNDGVVVAGGYDGQLRIWRANGPVLQTIGPPPEPSSEELAETAAGPAAER